MHEYANRFRTFDGKLKTLLDNQYFTEALLKSTNLFKYNGLPVNIFKLEAILQCDRMAGFFYNEEKDELYPVVGGLAGRIDDNGYGTRFYGATPNRTVEYDLADGVVGFNNSMRISRMPLFERYAEFMSDIDISLKAGIIYSRNINIPVVSSETEKEQMKKVLDSILAGDMEIMTSDILRQKMNQEIQMLPITDVNTASKLQSLTMLRDEIVREYWLESGCSISSKNKTAQTISDEIHDMDAVALNIIDDMLKCRQDMVAALNEKYGFNGSVELADCVKESQSDTIKNEEVDKNGEEAADTDTDRQADGEDTP